MRDFNFHWAVSLSVFAEQFRKFEHKNYYWAGVQIKFKFSAERKHLAIPLSEN